MVDNVRLYHNTLKSLKRTGNGLVRLPGGTWHPMWRGCQFALVCSMILLGWIVLVSPINAWAASEPDYTVEEIQQFEDLKAKAVEATQTGKFAIAEPYWTQLIELFPDSAALWSNRGNVRAAQNKLEEAIADYTQAIQLAPDEPDPYLNRGAVYEGLGQWEAAIADYNHLLSIHPNDMAALNNRGSAKAGRGDWDGAIADYTQAMRLDTTIILPQLNRALALYQVNDDEQAIQTLKGLARKYPRFADARAALTAILWDQGKQGEAESNWVAANGLDRRYRDIDWVEHTRRWPPRLVEAMRRFLSLQS